MCEGEREREKKRECAHRSFELEGQGRLPGVAWFSLALNCEQALGRWGRQRYIPNKENSLGTGDHVLFGKL